MKKFNHKKIQKLLLWYEKNKRDLPWRKDRDPYKIWISEVMLQQTTSQYVTPYFNRFIKKYPDLKSLSQASEEDLFKLWSGLGYYSRIKNVLKTSRQILKNQKIPKNHREWQSLPGIGPYTARAISSQAFQEKVGVLDGNTIRVLSRKEGLRVKWWNVEGRNHLQKLADECSKLGDSDKINQALMELGATVCMPKNPSCFLCPWQSCCKAYEKNLISQLPLKKPKTRKEIWQWKPFIYQIKDEKNRLKIAFIKNNYAPFLKGYFIFPGKVKRLNRKPKHFDFTHTITHHHIYTQVKCTFSSYLTKTPSVLRTSHFKTSFPLMKKKRSKTSLAINLNQKNIHWFLREKIKEKTPSSLIQKTLEFL